MGSDSFISKGLHRLPWIITFNTVSSICEIEITAQGLYEKSIAIKKEKKENS